jgi:hypothetical protein
MNSTVRSVALAMAISIGVGANAAHAQTAPMQKLKVSGRYLTKADGLPLFWLSDTAWALPKLSNAEVDQYLSDRAAKKFSAILIALKFHTDILFNAQGPWLNDNTDAPNEQFWQHIDYIVAQAQDRGLYVAVTMMWTDDYLSMGLTTDAAKAYRMGHWIGDRYKNQNNIVWVVSGEYNYGNWPKVYDDVAQGLKDGDLGNHLLTIHPGGFPVGSSSPDYHDASWLSFNFLQSGHYIDSHAHDGFREGYDLVTEDWSLLPIKPVVDGECTYEDLPDGYFVDNDANAPRIGPDTVRRKAYWSVFAGACGHTYGDANVEMLNTGDNSFGARNLWQVGLNDPGAGQMRYLRDLIEAHSFLNRIPDQSLIVSGVGTGLDYVEATRASDGNYALIYIPSGTTLTVDLTKLSNQPVAASWFNPRDGSSSSIGTFSNSGTQSFDPPGTVQIGNDWVLVLEAARALQFSGAVSRKIHQGVQGFTPQAFDIILPGEVECRKGSGINGNTHTLVFNFTNNVTAGTVVWKSGTGNVVNGTSANFSGRTISVDLRGVADAQKITVTLQGVRDIFGQTLANTDVSMNVLLGDTNNSKTVNASDVAQTKSQTGIAATQTTFRRDVTINGQINASDISLVKSRSGRAIP